MNDGNGSSQPPPDVSRVTSALQERISLYSSLVQEAHLNATGAVLLSLESELRQIDTLLATLRRQRNTLVPISRFPPEILSHIFQDLAELEPHATQSTEDYEDLIEDEMAKDCGWIIVTQVCHVWRQTALADSRLWTAATTFFDLDWFKRMARFGGAQIRQLDLWVRDGTRAGDLVKLATKLGLLTQVHHLRILGEESELSRLAVFDAPSLKSLHVHVDTNEESLLIPDVLFKGNTAQLGDLYAHNVAVRLTAPYIHSLTDLSLTIGYFATPALIAFQVLADALKSLSMLKRFTMQGYSLEILDDDIPTTDRMDIICPLLMDVNIFIRGYEGLFLLITRLRPSPAARVSFASGIPNSEGLHSAVILDGLQRLLVDADRSPVLGMQTIEFRARAPASWRVSSCCDGPGAPHFERSIVLSTWRNNRPDHLLRDYEGYRDPSLSSPDFQLAFNVPTFLDHHRPLDEIIPFGAFRHARSISIRPVYRQSFDISFVNGWQEIFRTAQKLEWLRVDRNVAESLMFDAYAIQTDPFPETLRTLAMLGVRWEHNWNEECESVGEMFEATARDSSINKVIIGLVPSEMELVQTTGWATHAQILRVKRPEWFIDGHEDWDDLADY